MEYRNYSRELVKFALNNRERINMERAKLLLRTLPNDLKMIEKKELFEFKFKGHNHSESLLSELHVKDHLPFVKN